MRTRNSLVWVLGLAACGSVQSGASDAPIADAAVDAPPDAAPITLNRQHVVFSAADAGGIDQIFSIRLDGTDKRQITHEAQQTIFGAVSPDGKKVVFTTTIASNEDIFVINTDGTGRRQLTSNAASDFRPAFSADGLRIAFISTRDTAGIFQVFLMTLADGDAGAVKQVAPSANSQEFATMGGTNEVGYTETFTNAMTMATQTDVMSAHEDGTAIVNLTNNAANDETSSYSRDGTKIVFASDRAVAGAAQLWMMNADGSNPTQITTDASLNRFHPSFDATGEHIVYEGSLPAGGANLFIANADGTGETALTTAADKFVEKMGSWIFVE
jgi:Tol biopolymer transport system component